MKRKRRRICLLSIVTGSQAREIYFSLLSFTSLRFTYPLTFGWRVMGAACCANGVPGEQADISLRPQQEGNDIQLLRSDGEEVCERINSAGKNEKKEHKSSSNAQLKSALKKTNNPHDSSGDFHCPPPSVATSIKEEPDYLTEQAKVTLKAFGEFLYPKQ